MTDTATPAPLFLVTITANRGKWREVALVARWQDAVEAAKRHVGEHNPIDGCSTPVHEWRSAEAEDSLGPRLALHRNTSFGERTATVVALVVDSNFVTAA